MDEQEFQNIKDWVDEFKIAIVDYPNAPNLSWIVEYVPLLITTIEETQLKLKSCKSLAKLERENLLERNTDLTNLRNKQNKGIADLRTQLAEVVEMLADCGVYVTDEKGKEYVTLRKQLDEAQEKLEWLRCLEQAGVDNWEGYGYAGELQEEMINARENR